MRTKANLLLVILLCTSSMSWAAVTIIDSNSILSGAFDQVVVQGTGTVVLMEGGTANVVLTMDNAVFNMTGGTVGSLYSHDDSQMNISGGSVDSHYTTYGQGNSVISFSGTSICTTWCVFGGNSSFYVSDSAQVNEGYEMYDNSVVHIEGGILNGGPDLDDTATGIISGGTFGAIGETYVNGDSRLIIVGNNITKRPYTTTSVRNGEVTGDWESGASFSIPLSSVAYSKVQIQSPLEALCTSPPSNDLDDDCVVSMTDFQMLAADWLDCGLQPQSACWE